jgi:N6-L-threonylcarbamoyladenine synthase
LSEDSLDFSFSGLKTSVVNFVNNLGQKKSPLPIADICASFQEAVVEVLVEKSIKAVRIHNYSTLVMGGGVASNQRLRLCMQKRCLKEGIHFYVPAPVFCTDNAAMTGLAGYHQYLLNHTISPDTDVYPRSPLN